jgi:hypothetical protein
LADGDREWWVNGERLAEAEFNRRMKPAPEAAKLRDTQATLDVIRAERDALRTKLEAGTICWAEVGKHAGAVCADNENLKQQVERLKARLPVTVDDGRDTYVLSCGEFVPCTTPAKKPAKRKAKKPAKKATQAQREKVCREFGLKQGSRVRARWSVNGAPDELPEAWTDDGICSAPNGSAHFTRTLAEFRAFVAKHFKKPAKKGRK